jgi:hypothetical protein
MEILKRVNALRYQISRAGIFVPQPQIFASSHVRPDSLTPTHPAASPDISMTSNWSSFPMRDFSRSRISPGV